MLPSTYRFVSESDEPAPPRLDAVDDRLTADEALRRVRGGAWLLHGGDFHNARQLLAAMGRRLDRARAPAARAPAEAFRAERRQRALEQRTLGRVLVALDDRYRLALGRAPDVARACREAWGEPQGVTVVSLRTLLGLLGAAEWRRRGLRVPGLQGTLTPHYGVYLPTRSDYVELLASVGGVRGARVLDVGTGTGVLAFVLLQKGAASAVGTDREPRALACARENALRLGLGERFTAVEADLFPPGDGRYELVVSNPPWIPEPPRTRVDRAVFDEGGRFLQGLLQGAPARLAPGGRLLLLLSDLAVRLGVREAGWLEAALARAGLGLVERRDARARHGKARDRSDPLHQARSGEMTSLYVLEPTGTPSPVDPPPALI